ncbi:MAG: energy-coupling factor ABC transporter ATP-binding protein [Sulfurovum sp.]|nr:energy-coupling factor ABC transporter ATP-binding protein [Sulfurovum sp.]
MQLKITDYTDDVLKQISFTLHRGENLVILGANGVGKTTLAKVLCGLIPSECVEVCGINPSKHFGTKRAKYINYLPPKLEVYDAFLSVEAFLQLSHFNTALSIEGVLKQLHITHLKEQPCHTLSSGEAQLVLIASALLHGADFTLFDEPTANLDPVRMRRLFTLLHTDATLPSKLVITHNLDLAYRLGFDVLYLHQGKVAFHGSSEAFFAQENLDALYESSVRHIDGHVVVTL